MKLKEYSLYGVVAIGVITGSTGLYRNSLELWLLGFVISVCAAFLLYNLLNYN